MPNFRFTDRRKNFRHELHYPLIKVLGDDPPEKCQLQNIGDGGLAVYSRHLYEKGTMLEVSFPILGEGHTFTAEVVWCSQGSEEDERNIIGGKYVPGDDKKFAWIVEKLCHVESYREMQEHLLKKEITPEQAAKEWIAKYGDTFPE